MADLSMWLGTMSQDDREYASELMLAHSRELTLINIDLSLAHDVELKLANDILKRFMLQ